MQKLYFISLLILLVNCKKDDPVEQTPQSGLLQLFSVNIGSNNLSAGVLNQDLPIDKNILVSFSQVLDTSSAPEKILLKDNAGELLTTTFAFLDNNKAISIFPDSLLKNDSEYQLEILDIKSQSGDVFPGAIYKFKTEKGKFELISATVNGQNLLSNARIQDVPSDFTIELNFSEKLNPSDNLSDYFFIGNLNISAQQQSDPKQVNLVVTGANYLNRYNFIISSNLKSIEGFQFAGFSKSFYTQIDSSNKFPVISDDQLLTKIEQETFKYFWDFAHPNCGLARERNTSGNTVTIGGSGFGVMAILVGIERGFISRQQGVDRLETIVNFLENADRFHGVWPHWMDGNTGNVIPFGSDDNGADLVETAFMVQGLLTVRQYLQNSNAQELLIKNKITQLWQEVEWDWFTKGGENVLYWHWSPNLNWIKNLRIRGWNESLIVYVLAASSPTHSINTDVFNQGWASNGSMINGNSYYNINLPLGETRGGPLFFAHYSFLGLDPRNLSDQYANYWEQNKNHTLINREYCIDNPINYIGYSESCWGLTASDNHESYSAHSPTNDKGVITPTAALSSLPYTPTESMDAIRHFYYLLGDKIWGEYGFYDAFNITENWFANSYLAIDQGPIIIMIENHRTALLWDLFMADTEVQAGLNKLGFTY